MRKYNRKESFRYTFEEPLAALFEISKVDGHKVSTSEGEAKIINISPHGIKLNSHLKIPETDHQSIELSISFELNDKQINVSGDIVWMKNKGISVDYGIDLIADDSTEKEIIEQLKIYSKEIHHLKD